MTETERLCIIWATVAVLIVGLVCATIVWLNVTAAGRLGPQQQREQQRKVEEIRACAHAVDVASCLRDATG